MTSLKSRKVDQKEISQICSSGSGRIPQLHTASSAQIVDPTTSVKNMSNSIDLELAPLVNEQVISSEEETRTFSKSAKLSMAIGSLLSLSAIAVLSYGNSSSIAPMSVPMDMSSNKAICKGTYIQGVTMRSAADGCAIISNGDMYGWDGVAMPTITYCVGAGDPDGTLGFDYASIKSHGELDLDNDGRVLVSIHNDPVFRETHALSFQIRRNIRYISR